jgi:hypothetical protein
MFEGFRQLDVQTNLVRSVALPCGHYTAEQAPDETYRKLHGFFRN